MLLEQVLFSFFVLSRHLAFALAGSNNSLTQSGFQAVIKDHNGVDITSSFQIMIYQDKTPVQNASLHNRQPFSARPINNCRVPNSYFRSSVCRRTDGAPLGMQSWRIFCHVPHNVSHPETGEIMRVWVAAARNGRCEDHETCVDSLDLNDYNQMTHVARCVSQEDYVFVKDPKNFNREIEFANRRANIMLSKSDRTTPLEVDKFTVQAGTVGDLEQSKKCQDCVQLRTDPFLPDTERLKTEVRLLTTGAATGILWLALMSG